MIDQVVAGEGIDELALARKMRASDLHDLPVPAVHRQGAGRDEVGQIVVEQCCHHDHPRTVGRRSAPPDPSNRVTIAADRLPNREVNSGLVHGLSMQVSSDTSLTR